MNHRGMALRANAGLAIRDSLFLFNDVGMQTEVTTYVGMYAQVNVESCIFLMNRIGIAVYNGARIEGGWICGQPLDNSSDLIQINSPSSMEVSDVWFGIPGQYESIIRGSIKDGYWLVSSGLVHLIQVSDRPTAWPTSLQSFNFSYSSLCSAPRDRGFDLAHPPSGLVTGNLTWLGSGTVTEIGSALFLSAGSVLTIEAGAVLRFTSASAVLVVKGTLIANGRPDARIVFDGSDMTSRALQIPAIEGVNVNVSYATFSNFSRAVSLEPSEWPKISLYFEDCVFEGNGAAIEGGYTMGATVDFLRCEFSSNLRPASVESSIGYGGQTRFDSCFFHSQDRGVNLMAYYGLALGALL